MMRTITIYCDGLVEPHNPGGYGCWGWLAVSSDPQESELGRDYGCLGKTTTMSNNLAEYQAVLRALRQANRQKWQAGPDQKLVVRTDSQLVVRQIRGEWACQASHLQPLRDEARELLAQLGGQLEWVPREDNQRADGLTRLAYAIALRQSGLKGHDWAEMLRSRPHYHQRRLPPRNPAVTPAELPPVEPVPRRDQPVQLPLF